MVQSVWDWNSRKNLLKFHFCTEASWISISVLQSLPSPTSPPRYVAPLLPSCSICHLTLYYTFAFKPQILGWNFPRTRIKKLTESAGLNLLCPALPLTLPQMHWRTIRNRRLTQSRWKETPAWGNQEQNGGNL